MKKTLLLLTIGCALNLFSQEEIIEIETNPEPNKIIDGCGTDNPTIEQQAQRTADIAARITKSGSKRETVNSYTVKLVPVTYHVLQDDDGSNGITQDQIDLAMERVNGHFKQAGIEFFACGAVQYHKSTTLNAWDKYIDDAAVDGFHVANTLNIYFASSVTSGTSGICGYAYFPSSKHYTVMANSCAYNGTTFEHELGHYYNLYHTHQTFSSVLEIVARPGEGKATNCATEGDKLCDTHADPILTGISLTNCVPDPTALGTGPNGDQYRTDATNIMSYAGTKSCRSLFTQEQLNLMNTTVHNNSNRNNYTCPDAPISDFSSNKTSDCIQSTVNFHEQSSGTGSKTYLWTFEGGNPNTSTIDNPVVSYVTSGKFDVTLKVTTNNGTNTITKTDLINITYPIGLPYSEDFSSSTNLPAEIATETNKASNDTVFSLGWPMDNGLALVGGSGVYHTFADTAQTFISNPHYTSAMKLSCVNATKYSDLTLNFDYKPLYDSKKEYTSIRILINGTQVGNYIQPADSGGEIWTAYSLDLTPYVGAYIDIVVEVNGKTSNNGIYIDNINVDGTLTLSNNDDAGILTIESPNAGANYCSSAIIPTVKVKNYSSNTLTSVNVTYSIDGILYPTITKTGLSVTSEGTTSINLNTMGTLGFGTHSFKAFTSLPNGNSDDYALNDTLITAFTVGGGVLGVENFDSQLSCGTDNDCETTVCNITGNWSNTNDGSDEIDWRVDNNGTTSASTGPSTDHTLGTVSGQYIYLETSACYGKTALLKSRCMNLSSYESSSLSFWYHMYGVAMGTLTVDIEVDGITTTAITTITGDQGDTWIKKTLDLTTYNGTAVYITFKGVSGTEFTSDIALDDIEVIGTISIDTSITIAGDLMICQGATTTFVGVSNNDYTYQWKKDGLDINGATASNYQAGVSGSYTVTVSYNGSSKTCTPRVLVVDICTGIDAVQADDFTLYPNPTSGILNILVPSNAVLTKTTIINNQAQVVLNVNGAVKAVNMQSLAPGIYNVQLIINGVSVNKVVVKQ
ncbi:MAG: PKD repeat protein [Saprospiraceae bacterium]|jgi:PKD repeat protein